MAKERIRVLHAIDAFLRVSENWIYPQVAAVPRTVGAVICDRIENRGAFPLSWWRLIGPSPPWKHGLGIPRVAAALAEAWNRAQGYAERRAKFWRPDLLHAHFGTNAYRSLPLKERLRIPLIASFYGHDAWALPTQNPEWEKRFKEVFAAGEAFLVEGSAMRSRLLELGCPGDKIHIQRLGANVVALPFESKTFRSELRVAMVGRFVEKKGFPDGLRACAMARAQGVKLQVTIVGDSAPDDVPGLRIRSELMDLANTPELAGCVRFAGFLPMSELRTLLQNHNVFLCPSKHSSEGDAEGGSPVVLTEAMAMGLFCIGTRHCDIPEVILHRQTGYVAEESAVDELAEFICMAYRTPEASTAMAAAGRRHVKNNFSLSSQLSQLSRFYRSLLWPAPVNEKGACGRALAAGSSAP